MVTALFLAGSLASAFLLHCLVVGAAVLRGLRLSGGKGSQSQDWAWTSFFSICLGMLVNMAGLFILGVSGQLNLMAVAGLGALLFVVALAVSRGVVWQPIVLAGNPGTRRIVFLQLGILLVLFALTIVATLHPPGHWDDTMYHLPLARHYVEQGGIVLNEYLRFPLFPQNFNLLFVLGMLLGHAVSPPAGELWQSGAPELFSQVFASLPLFVLVLGLWAASRRYFGTALPGLLAGLSLYALRPVKSTLGFAYIDDGLAMFCLAAALAVAWAAEFIPQRDRQSGLAATSGFVAVCVLAGLLAGAACGTKYFGVVFAAQLGVVLLVVAALRAARTPGHAWLPAVLQAGLVYTAAVLLAGCWWYVRSFLISGDPVHPAGGPVFGYFLWDEGDLAFQKTEQAMHGVGTHPLMFPAALLKAGVGLWLPALAGLFLRGLSPAVRVLQAVFLSYLIFWFFVTQVYRYLAPVYGVGGLLAFHALYQAGAWLAGHRHKDREEGRKGQGIRVLERPWVYGLLLLIAVVYTGERSVKHGESHLHADAVLNRIAGFGLYQEANRHRDVYGSRIVQLGFEKGIYFFKGTVIGDWFGPGRYRDFVTDCPAFPCQRPPIEALQQTLRTHGARMLLISRDALTDLDEAGMQAEGWRVLASDEKGVLLASP